MRQLYVPFFALMAENVSDSCTGQRWFMLSKLEKMKWIFVRTLNGISHLLGNTTCLCKLRPMCLHSVWDGPWRWMVCLAKLVVCLLTTKAICSAVLCSCKRLYSAHCKKLTEQQYHSFSDEPNEILNSRLVYAILYLCHLTPFLGSSHGSVHTFWKYLIKCSGNKAWREIYNLLDTMFNSYCALRPGALFRIIKQMPMTSLYAIERIKTKWSISVSHIQPLF